MEVIVTGSRELYYAQQFFAPLKQRFKSHAAVTAEVWLRLDQLHAVGDPLTKVIVGGAKGPDTAAQLWAEANGVDCWIYKPNWNRHGRAAGFKRNWVMLFRTAGPEVSSSRRTKLLADIEVLVKRVASDKLTQKYVPAMLHDLVAFREALADPSHPHRRAVMRALHIPVPSARVLAFWDGRSAGTRHCIKAARTLGYNVDVHLYLRPELEMGSVDKGKIDHRPDTGGDPSFSSFMESGCGRF